MRGDGEVREKPSKQRDDENGNIITNGVIPLSQQRPAPASPQKAMSQHKTPELSEELFKRIKLVRRDVGNLLFHFTRAPSESLIEVNFGQGRKMTMSGSTSAVLRKILYEGGLKGTSRWSYGQNCVCFTEAPIQEFNSIFSLIDSPSAGPSPPNPT